MNEIQLLCSILLSVLTILYVYLGIYAIVGFFTTKQFASAKHLHKYAVVIAARNEANIIGNLLQSIRSQTYPQTLITVFVVADNCTDHTALAARKNRAVCYERFDTAHCTKGYALQFLFQQIQRDYGINSFDGYLLLDADNLLKEDYLEKMNNAFDSGEKIITSYRNTVNLNSSCIAASYALHWLRTVRMEHRARSAFNLSTRVQGTGILFSHELVKNGWNYTSLTEDRAFCADAVLQGYSVSYQNEAEFYDEQPTDILVAFQQRIRWAKGHLQAFSDFAPDLLHGIFTVKSFRRRFIFYDTLLVTLPYSFICVILNLIQKTAFLLSLLLLSKNTAISNQLIAILISAVSALLWNWLRQTVMAAYIFFIERKKLEPLPLNKIIWYCMTFFLFDLIGKIAFFIAACFKVEWKPTPHYGKTAHIICQPQTFPNKSA